MNPFDEVILIYSQRLCFTFAGNELLPLGSDRKRRTETFCATWRWEWHQKLLCRVFTAYGGNALVGASTVFPIQEILLPFEICRVQNLTCCPRHGTQQSVKPDVS